MTSPAPSSDPHDLAPRSELTAAVLLSAVVAALGGLLFGYDTAVISGAEKAIQLGFALDPFWHGFTVASALIGTIVGSVIIERPADSIGRKRTLFLLAVLYLVSSLGCALAPSWWILVVSRFVGGIAIGGASVVSPMYIAEISPPHLRGRLSRHQPAQCRGRNSPLVHLELCDQPLLPSEAAWCLDAGGGGPAVGGFPCSRPPDRGEPARGW